MNKKVLIWISIIILSIIGIFIIIRINDKRNNKENLIINQERENFIELSNTNEIIDGEVTDECLNEWQDYNQFMSKRIEEASNNLSENDTHYLLKDVLGYIEVYYLDADNKEFLYKKTNIPTVYLSQEDIEDLKIGIEVVGIEALNKMLEDFE